MCARGKAAEPAGRAGRKLSFPPRGHGKGCVNVPVYDEDGHVAATGKKKSRRKLEARLEEEHTVPWIAALTTYFGYAILMIFGTVRDVLLNLNFLTAASGSSPEKKGYGRLMNDFQDFYTRRLYNRIQDCFNRPISSAPGAWIQVMERDFANPEQTAMEHTGSDITALNLSSYNYLGFAESDLGMRDEVCASMRRLGVSTCTARSELGTTDDHLELEQRIAAFLGKPAAMVLGMGFASNSTVLPVLAGRGGLIISDELNHSSIVTGARASAAQIKVFKHNCAMSLENALRRAIAEGQPRTRLPWKKILVVIEGLYSMEGEICNLKEIVAVCKKYKAYVYVDEAHSIGALGATGRGVLEHCGVKPSEVDVCMGTFTKSFGSVGGYVAASEDVVAFLKRSCPGHVAACSMAPACVRQASLALRMIAGEDGSTKGRRKIDQLKRNANLFRAGLERMGCEVCAGVLLLVFLPVMATGQRPVCVYALEKGVRMCTRSARTRTHAHTHTRAHTGAGAPGFARDTRDALQPRQDPGIFARVSPPQARRRRRRLPRHAPHQVPRALLHIRRTHRGRFDFGAAGGGPSG